MGVGDDLKQVFSQVGVGYTIIRPGGNITGEFLDYTPNTQVSKPFTKEHFLEVEFAYDTQTVPGDTIQFADGRRFLVMHHAPELLGSEVLVISAVLYRTNVKLDVKRYAKSGSSAAPVSSWSILATNVDAVVLTEDYGAREADRYVANESVDRTSALIHIPKTVSFELGDRFVLQGFGKWHTPGGVTNLKVGRIDDFEFRGVSMCYMTEDPRA